MDNASFHKRVKRPLNRHGNRLLFLPPYNPDLNPIEKKWAQAKFLHQGWMENNYLNYFMICDVLLLSWIDYSELCGRSRRDKLGKLTTR